MACQSTPCCGGFPVDPRDTGGPAYHPPDVLTPVKKTTISAEEAARIPWPPGGPGKPCQCRKFLCGQNVDIIPSKKRYINPPRMPMVQPRNNFCFSKEPLQNETIYRGSYFGTEYARVAPELPRNQLCFSSARMDDHTTQKLSYPGWYNIDPPCPMLPCIRPMLGEGPMQDVTTQKHDYVPKPYSKRMMIPNEAHLCSGKAPLENNTTNRLSYQYNCVPRMPLAKPPGQLCFSKDKFAKDTTQKLSYMPNAAPSKIPMPWADRGTYRPPTQKVENNTVYRMSYDPPGCLVDDPNAADCPCKMGGCYCAYPGQCFGIPDPRCTLYPKAAVH